MSADVAGFIVVSAIVIVTPGPDTALTIRNTLLGGRDAGILSAVGVITGQLTWAFCSSLGAEALLRIAPVLFAVVRVLGAGYLVFLGMQALRAAWQRRAHGRLDADTRGHVGRGSALRQGIISNLTNAKMAVFFPSLLPQFVPSEHATFVALFTLGVLFATMTLLWLSLYAVAIERFGALLRSPTAQRALEGATGVALVLIGARVVLE